MDPWTCNFQKKLKEVLIFSLGPLKCKFLSSFFQFAAISEVDLGFLIICFPSIFDSSHKHLRNATSYFVSKQLNLL